MLDSTLGLEEPSLAHEDADTYLALQAGQGDEAAYVCLYEKYFARTKTLCRRMRQREEEIEDLSQIVWLQVYRKLHQFQGDAKFTTWLHRLTINQVLMHIRAHRIDRLIEYPEIMPEPIASGSARPNNMRITEILILEEALALLPAGYHQVLVHHDIFGFEHEEIAVILGIAVGTSKSQLNKARKRLSGLLRREKLTSTTKYVVAERFDTKRGIELPALSVTAWNEIVATADELDYVNNDYLDPEGDSYDDYEPRYDEE